MNVCLLKIVDNSLDSTFKSTKLSPGLFIGTIGIALVTLSLRRSLCDKQAGRIHRAE
jgi:hypothetical protein